MSFYLVFAEKNFRSTYALTFNSLIGGVPIPANIREIATIVTATATAVVVAATAVVVTATATGVAVAVTAPATVTVTVGI